MTNMILLRKQKNKMATKNKLISNLQLKAKKNVSIFERTKISNSSDAFAIIRKFYFDDIEIYESFFILCLNRANETIAYAKISQGGLAGTVVDVKIIAKYAIDCLATSVILAHNHPSGNLKPSTADINITKKIKASLEILDILVFDHIIITSNNHFSFADEGLL